MIAHSLWPDTAMMMGAAPVVGADDNGRRGSGSGRTPIGGRLLRGQKATESRTVHSPDRLSSKR